MSDKKSTSFENKYTVEDLRIMQSWSLQTKIQVTQSLFNGKMETIKR